MPSRSNVSINIEVVCVFNLRKHFVCGTSSNNSYSESCEEIIGNEKK